ncbi:MAG: hypothetical protein ACK518_04380 [bacterium]|jgi:hypothetical protein
MPSLFDIIKRDAKFIVNSGGYQVEIEMITPDGYKKANITGWAVKTSGSFDSDGNQVNTKNVHCTIDENALIALGYPVRTNKKGILEVDLIQHKVNFKDSSGILKHYQVRENMPDENLGLITLWLGDYKPS